MSSTAFEQFAHSKLSAFVRTVITEFPFNLQFLDNLLCISTMHPSEYEEPDNYENDSGNESESGSSSVDVDAPRVAQWEDDEDLEDDLSSSEEEQRPIAGPSRKPEENIKSIRNDLSSVSYAALLKARRALAQAEAQSDDSENSGSDAEEEERETGNARGTSLSNFGQQNAARQKRKNKHAPVEMSAKIPVSRKKVVVDVKKKVHRDPRFSALSGELSVQKFQSQYSFLADMHGTELSNLKENLARAKKLLRSSPRDLREAREDEVQKLEAALKRAESTVNRDRQEQVTRVALEKVKKEEQEKQKQGKSGWWMKDSAKKELLLKARHDALVETGGKAAVKKAIEKRQRKVNQKEKRSMPSFAPRTPNTESSSSLKRHRTSSDSNHKKRRKFS
ncbi:DUF947-domain-containing protein [Schizopora paradoxa]|uniref:rRNA biogenesis protein RRP36 n=1 Tax=Schizopora paradoxa TaxID=27342 RepID=A0A0H2RZJ5_9AGAM|nr:DUF947-domain-containing protein [Schizopora paradoxa]